MNLYLIRHTKVNVKPGICYGQTDVETTASFIDEANQIKEQLSYISFDKVYSSPLKRCKQLTEFLFDQDIIFDERLKELNFGDWEMQEWDQIKDPEYFHWMNNYIDVPCLNGESFTDLHQRVKNFMNELVSKDYKNVVIISHGGPIRSILTLINHYDLKDAFNFQVAYCEIQRITI